MKRSQLHTAAHRRGDYWRSWRPHWPGACEGRFGDPCLMENNRQDCDHKHHTSDAALACSRRREPFA